MALCQVAYEKRCVHLPQNDAVFSTELGGSILKVNVYEPLLLR